MYKKKIPNFVKKESLITYTKLKSPREDISFTVGKTSFFTADDLQKQIFDVTYL